MSAENSVSVQSAIFGPFQIQLRDNKTHALLYQQVLYGPGTFVINDIPDASLNQLQLISVPGKPSTGDNFQYQLPFNNKTEWSISQGFLGEGSHQDILNAYALDFSIAIGTEVLAARSGIVMEVIDSYSDSPTTTRESINQANLIRIVHADGSMGVYAHLLQDSALVSPGQWIAKGKPIAQSGNSGFSSGPHLHFAVQVNSGMQLQSIVFEIRDFTGKLVPMP